MKKLILLLLLMPSVCLAQIDGVITFKGVNTVVSMNDAVIEYLTANIDNIESVDGQTVLYVPYEKMFHKDAQGVFVDDYFAQYEIKNGKAKQRQVQTRYMVFDFEKHKINKVTRPNDDLDFKKPSDVDDKIDDKIKNKTGTKKP